MLGDWLKEALKVSRVSGSELSRQLTVRLGRSIDPAAVTKMQKGQRRISADEMLAISEITGFPSPDAIAAEVASVPLISWVSAGAMVNVSDMQQIDRIRTIALCGLPDGDWFALTVDGDSMNRISPPGSVIAVNMRDRRLVPNACYIIANEEGETTYKRYRPSPERYEPVSTNDEHHPLFPNGAIRVIGRVKFSILEL